MRLALNKRKKALGFLSTVGVVAGLDHPEAVLESEDGPSLCSEHPGDGGYAVGSVFLPASPVSEGWLNTYEKQATRSPCVNSSASQGFCRSTFPALWRRNGLMYCS